MPTKTQPILLVTPVWNDSKRLKEFGSELARALTQSGLPIEWIIADDGSSAEEKEQLDNLYQSFAQHYQKLRILHVKTRSYKGGAIYQAWDSCPQAQWLAFVDADGAISPSATIEFIKRAYKENSGACFTGIRHHSKSTPVSRKWTRSWLSHIFAAIVQATLGIRHSDPQCGIKMLPNAHYQAIANQLHERGFAFDVELLLALRNSNCPIYECPIPWTAKSGGKITISRDGWNMLQALFRIRKRLKSGVYQP